MRYSEARPGRVFVIRLEDGDILHEELEKFAAAKGIKAASLIALGGADKGSKIVVGPAEARANPVVPMLHELSEVHEIAATGTIFPNEEGQPVLHMHMAGGRAGYATAGCVRAGVRVWHVLEVILYELIDCDSKRLLEEASGFELLNP